MKRDLQVYIAFALHALIHHVNWQAGNICSEGFSILVDFALMQAWNKFIFRSELSIFIVILSRLVVWGRKAAQIGIYILLTALRWIGTWRFKNCMFIYNRLLNDTSHVHMCQKQPEYVKPFRKRKQRFLLSSQTLQHGCCRLAGLSGLQSDGHSSFVQFCLPL